MQLNIFTSTLSIFSIFTLTVKDHVGGFENINSKRIWLKHTCKKNCRQKRMDQNPCYTKYSFMRQPIVIELFVEVFSSDYLIHTLISYITQTSVFFSRNSQYISAVQRILEIETKRYE